MNFGTGDESSSGETERSKKMGLIIIHSIKHLRGRGVRRRHKAEAKKQGKKKKKKTR